MQLPYNQDININAYNVKGFTPLICAIQNKNYELIQAILQRKDIDTHKTDINHLKITPLAYAAQLDDIKSVDILFKP